MVKRERLSERTQGAVQPILLLVLVNLSLFSFGLWGVLRYWRFLVEDQLRLDRCIGELSQQFRSNLNTLTGHNVRIKELRVAIAAAQIQPAVAESLRIALKGLVLHQDWVRGKWKAQLGLWWADPRCHHRKDRVVQLSDLLFFREPSDPIGEKPLEWKGEMPHEFRFEMAHGPRSSAAVVKRGEHGRPGKSEKWDASWSRPTGPVLGLGWPSPH